MIGDNDNLSAIVAVMAGADLLVILSDIDGLYTKNPGINPDAKLIRAVGIIDDKIQALASGAVSDVGTGGMVTKLQAAKYAQDNDISTYIISGKDPGALYDLFEGKQIGTYFKKRSEIVD